MVVVREERKKIGIIKTKPCETLRDYIVPIIVVVPSHELSNILVTTIFGDGRIRKECDEIRVTVGDFFAISNSRES